MQLKRLEAALDQQLVAREGRGIGLTREGEQLLGYGRRLVRLNDEAWDGMMHAEFQGRVNFGVPEDIEEIDVCSVEHTLVVEACAERMPHCESCKALWGELVAQSGEEQHADTPEAEYTEPAEAAAAPTASIVL